jgi:hypothetical protein
MFILIFLAVTQHTEILSEEEGIRAVGAKRDEVQGNVMS